ncbi:hypothetical protein [Brumicola pallidula]|jgi:hypothetical protein|uniref:Lipoprotein n=1 Tax=Brumicola pallidula DSM 14239 = ACAM 615 TaxID=1121922 RepID=K6ZUQ0_9ALTE|nr:hypothetical protein [Glaciecola pallidula]GAC27060.1 hypothetical protein GPAL_0179 [Glaciecola pallidula DSM 14239 = ACAM 615]
MNKLYIFVCLSMLITACGGGGSQSITAVPLPPAGEPLPVPIESQPAVTEFSLEESNPKEAGDMIGSSAKTSHEIVVPNGFALSSERSFDLRITRAQDDNEAAYLSLCSDYKQYNDGSYSINYDSCLLRTSLSDINYEAVIIVTNDTPGLVAALWFMDESKKPLITDWRF